MASVLPPTPVKYFIAVLFRDPACLTAACEEFVRLWGPIDYEGPDRPFEATGYYGPEMGAPLYRRLIGLERMAAPGLLVEMKLGCNGVEQRLSVRAKRTVNCDAGYLDHNKVVLASAKEAGQKIYLDKGIYADLAGRYKDGKYRPFEWSFPDFRDGSYDEELAAMRRLYLDGMRALRRGNGAI